MAIIESAYNIWLQSFFLSDIINELNSLKDYHNFFIKSYIKTYPNRKGFQCVLTKDRPPKYINFKKNSLTFKGLTLGELIISLKEFQNQTGGKISIDKLTYGKNEMEIKIYFKN